MASERVEFVYTGGGLPKKRTWSEIEALVTHVSVPPSVTVIEAGAFQNCTTLREVELCDGLRRIKSEAFRGCSSLERIMIPSTVEVIERHAFMNCTRLAQVKLLSGLRQIEEKAFNECNSLGIEETNFIAFLPFHTFCDAYPIMYINVKEY